VGFDSLRLIDSTIRSRRFLWLCIGQFPGFFRYRGGRNVQTGADWAEQARRQAIAGEVSDDASDQGTLGRLLESLGKIAPSFVTTAILQLIATEIPDLF
jgi:hypothetical protein